MATLWGVFSCRLLAVDWQPVVRHCVTSHVVMSCVWLSRVDQVCMCLCVHVQPVCCVVLVAAAFTSRLEADVVRVLEWWWWHSQFDGITTSSCRHVYYCASAGSVVSQLQSPCAWVSHCPMLTQSIASSVEQVTCYPHYTGANSTSAGWKMNK